MCQPDAASRYAIRRCAVHVWLTWLSTCVWAALLNLDNFVPFCSCVSASFSFFALWLAVLALVRQETLGRGSFNLWDEAAVVMEIGIAARLAARL